jgi:pimeloyl-ACP methyl ester carboxylesterase
VPPETRYARNGPVTLAWSASGAAPIDLLFIPGFISHVEHAWEEPSLAAFLERLSGFTRLIMMDRRGTGLSDRLDGPLSLEEEAADVGSVLDAAGSERAVLLGYTSGAPLAITFAAQRPERVRALILYAPIARAFAAPDYDWTWDEQERARAFERILESWGSGANVEDVAPSRAGDPRMRAWLARMERLSSAPGAMRTLFANLGAQDVRGLLPELRVPTLILHRTGDRLIDVRRPLRRTRGRGQPAERRRQRRPARRDRGVPDRRAQRLDRARPADDPADRHLQLHAARRARRRRRLARDAGRARRSHPPRGRSLRRPRGQDDRRRRPRRLRGGALARAALCARRRRRGGPARARPARRPAHR